MLHPRDVAKGVLVLSQNLHSGDSIARSAARSSFDMPARLAWRYYAASFSFTAACFFRGRTLAFGTLSTLLLLCFLADCCVQRRPGQNSHRPPFSSELSSPPAFSPYLPAQTAARGEIRSLRNAVGEFPEPMRRLVRASVGNDNGNGAKNKSAQRQAICVTRGIIARYGTARDA